MVSWKKTASIQNDVVFFEYVSHSNIKANARIFVWDLDKTYLDTHFESLRGLYRTVMEKAFQKKNVPGTRSLVRALTVRGESYFPIYFVSASPPQMEERIVEKIQYDGIQPYGLFLKDNLKNLRPGKLKRLGQQVGFKLQALLSLRLKFPFAIKQVLWGDDSESDAVIYSLYSDICARRIPEKSLRNILEHYHVRGNQLSDILELGERVFAGDPVERVYINLAADTDPDYYSKFGYRVLPTFNSFQVSLDLYQEEIINEKQLQQIILDLLNNYNFSREELNADFVDLVSRNVLHKKTVTSLQQNLGMDEKKIFGLDDSIVPMEQEDYDRTFKTNVNTWVPDFIDYLHDFR